MPTDIRTLRDRPFSPSPQHVRSEAEGVEGNVGSQIMPFFHTIEIDLLTGGDVGDGKNQLHLQRLSANFRPLAKLIPGVGIADEIPNPGYQ